MKKIAKLIKSFLIYLPDLPKTIFFNFYVFPFKEAIHLPVLISKNTVLKNVHRNCIEINCEIKNSIIIIGKGGLERILAHKKSYFSVEEGSKIVFNGPANFAMGSSIKVCNGGKLIFGENLSANRNFTLVCTDRVEFGNDVLIGWNVEIRDTDGHYIIDNSVEKLNHRSIYVGNHVWICSYVTIMKGCKIGNNCVVAYRSCVINSNVQDNFLIAGFPAKSIKQGINWRG